MTFNALQQLRTGRQNTQYQSEAAEAPLERTTSVLLELQSLWVLFSPTNTASEVAASDILLTTGESAVLSQATGDLSESTAGLDDDDLLIDRLGPHTAPAEAPSAASAAREETAMPTHLNQRINQWKLLREISIEDNEASWDLDENIVQNLLQANALDTSILSEGRSYYGDDLFDGYSKKEWVKFRKIADELKLSLSRKQDAPALLPVAMLMAMFRKEQEQEHSRREGERLQGLQAMNTARFKRYLTVLQLSNAHYNRKFLDSVIHNQLQYSGRGHLEEDNFSSTTSSSLVICE